MTHRVIGLDVELEVLIEAVGLEEADDRLRVVVVLVLGGLLGLRLEQELSLEADLLLVVDSHAQEVRQVVDLALHVRVEQRHVALAAPPEHEVLAAESMRHLEHLLDLSARIGERVHVRTCRRAVHVARIREQIRRAPQQLDARLALQLLDQVDDLVEHAVALGERGAFGRQVAIVKGVVGHAELGEELERGTNALLAALDRVGVRVPLARECGRAERIVALPHKCVP